MKCAILDLLLVLSYKSEQVRDVAQTIDAKEALHAQLLMTQQQYAPRLKLPNRLLVPKSTFCRYEDMRQAYEARLQELTQGVQAAQASADAARTQLNAAESKEKSGSSATQDAAAALKAAFEQVGSLKLTYLTPNP